MCLSALFEPLKDLVLRLYDFFKTFFSASSVVQRIRSELATFERVLTEATNLLNIGWSVPQIRGLNTCIQECQVVLGRLVQTVEICGNGSSFLERLTVASHREAINDLLMEMHEKRGELRGRIKCAQNL